MKFDLEFLRLGFILLRESDFNLGNIVKSDVKVVFKDLNIVFGCIRVFCIRPNGPYNLHDGIDNPSFGSGTIRYNRVDLLEN